MKKLLLALALVPCLMLAGTGLFAVPALAQPPMVITDPSQAFITGKFVVKGEGAAPTDRPLSAAQKRILAIRAAKVVAYRELGEIIDGVAILGDTLVQDAAVKYDVIRATTKSMIKGAKVVHESYDQASELATVYVGLGVDGQDGIYGQLVPTIIANVQLPTAPAYHPVAAPPPVPQAYDALILDITAHIFKPALINRILAQNGEILYDPTKIAQNILVERGAGDYTNDIGKAKAILSERGVKNPLIVKVSGVVKFTDVQVSTDDASNIFAANQKANFLEGAKVVFVLK